MTQRWSPFPDLTLCGGLALWLIAAQGAAAEVIDLGAGAEDLRVRASVLDFGKELPKRGDLNGAEFADEAETMQMTKVSLCSASYGTTPKGGVRVARPRSRISFSTWATTTSAILR